MADAKQNYDDTTKFISEISQEAIRLLAALGEYLDAEARYAPQKEMAKWIRNHGQCYAYHIQGNCANELKNELNERNIPYIDLMDGKTLIIKEPDAKELHDINHEILVAKANYYQSVDADMMEDIFAKSNLLKDKEVITLHDLSDYQCEVLKNKCNDITRGFMVGIEEESPGRYAVSIHAPMTYKDDPEKVDLCKAFAEMTYSLYGDNADIKAAQIEADNKLDKEIADLKGSHATKYVIGVDDPRRYLEINAQGFEFHRQVFTGKGVQDIEEKFVDKNDPAYDVELQKALDSISNKKLLSSHDELIAHLSTRKRNFETDRPEKSDIQARVSKMEKNIIDKADRMVKEGPMAEKMKEMAPADAFKAYQHEMNSVISAAIEDRKLSGYQTQDIKKIKDEFKEADVSPENYKQTTKWLESFTIEQHKAKEKTKRREKMKDTKEASIDDVEERVK
nr:hypothetical protein [uncultured Butyrivibrio sp.]